MSERPYDDPFPDVSRSDHRSATDPGPDAFPGDRDPSEVAEVMDTVAWDYDPGTEAISPLTPTERYFRDFPWVGDGE